MNPTRIGLIGLTTALVTLLASSCFTPQPAPECQVVNGQVIYSVTNYLAVLTPAGASTGACPNISTLEVGLERFHDPTTKDFALGIRASRIVDIANGYTTLADTDPSNDCTQGKNCSSCVATGDPELDNICVATDETNPRVDPRDPQAKKLTGIAKLSQFPDKAGLCKVDDLKVAEDFQAEDFPIADGGVAHFDDLPVAMDWSSMNVIMNDKVPGTAFTAKLKYTEGGCTANYDVLGFWPIVSCQAYDAEGNPVLDASGNTVGDDTQCDPSADLDAGRVTGSGISPAFKPVCKKYTDARFILPGAYDPGSYAYAPNPLGEHWYCTPTADLAKLK
jgi:hypothetical protein